MRSSLSGQKHSATATKPVHKQTHEDHTVSALHEALVKLEIESDMQLGVVVVQKK